MVSHCGVKNLQNSTSKKEKNNLKKRAKDLMTLLQRGHTDAQLTTMTYYLTPVRMVIINKSTNNKCWRGFAERGTLCTVDGNADWYSYYGKKYGNNSKI